MKKVSKLLVALLILAMALGVLASCSKQPAAGSSDAPVTDTQPGEDVPGAEALDRAEYAIPNQYTKVKIFFGSYGFGDAEITVGMNDDESAFYMLFTCFDEDQILEGTVSDGIAMVTYDKYGFVSMDAQLLYDDAIASEEAWHPLTGEYTAPVEAEPMSREEYAIPNQYTKVKVFFGSYGFGDAEITVGMNDDESAFYMLFTCFDEDQILEGTVSDGIAMVTYDKYGFVSMDAQLLYDDAMASEEIWHPLEGEGPASPSAE